MNMTDVAHRVTQTLYTTVTPADANADQTTVQQDQQQNVVTTTSDGVIYVIETGSNGAARLSLGGGDGSSDAMLAMVGATVAFATLFGMLVL
jgi:hypothetical protein